MTQNSTSEPRLSTEQVAAYLGLSKSTLDKFRIFGGGPIYAKLGRRVTYSRADIDQWVTERNRRSTSDTRSIA
jgi:excisionase family DNA binding protein